MKQWDKVYKREGKCFLEPEKYMIQIAKTLKRSKVRRVLDLGCGTGRHTVFLAKNGFEVYSFDIAEHGIKIAKKWLQNEELKAKFKIGNIYRKLPYKNRFFDAIVSIHVIHHARINKIRRLIKEIERILKPGGVLFVVLPRKKTKSANKYKMVAEHTYVPLEGPEKGLVHFLFTKQSLKKEFRDFKILKLGITQRAYLLFGKKN